MSTTPLPLWTREASARRSAWYLGLTTFSILVLELAAIRWIGSQIRVFAYFANLVLMAVFLGMGLGVALGRRYPHLFEWVFPALLVLAAVLALAAPVGLMHMGFPDPSISLWGADVRMVSFGQFCLATLVVVGLFWLVTLVFLLMAIPVGWWFGQLPPLRAYTYDLLGSLIGVLAFTAVAALHLPPAVWFGLGLLPLAWVSRRWWAAFGIGVIMLTGWASQGAYFSPYNRIDLATDDFFTREGQPPNPVARPEYMLSVNRDFHQHLLDLSTATVSQEPPGALRARVQKIYEIPFRLTPQRDRALVVGAGTGNDAAAALRAGFAHVSCVEIDPVILRLGREKHPEQPYTRPNVRLINNDARAWFEQNHTDQYDVVCYGLVDSHAMFSALSTLRLDNYLYTVEGLRSGWKHVAPGGVMSVSFSVFAGDWMLHRLNNTILEATGLPPTVVMHGYNYGVTFLVGRELVPQTVQATTDFPVHVLPEVEIRIPTDDWPFLYLRPDTVPYAYLTVLTLILVTALVAVRQTFGADLLTSRRFDPVLFLMGAAFLLLETRMVTELSLLFGSTWIVNASVFAGVLVMVLLANGYVIQRTPSRIQPWYVPLVISLLAVWWLGAGMLNQFSLLTRGILGGLLFALPVFFAGIIVSTLLKRARDVPGALGSNILGSVVGGCLEYLSMYAGLRKMTLLAIALYLTAYLILARQTAQPEAAEATPPLEADA
ncbi:methyltransferase domain-containing protein [Chloracidobacterium sp. MS 40/45]|uniref:methyltransferase domain-containing protein n=1 Tax=Chloracidobacterium aggregatum TaxID=2851959 RepID=UPI001B8B8882|nr:methyltransferase domain-containing protein [Chloracidobacterium aggregatum]QUV99902.1 methyltransferase domain-containing protein [Chloracidobacterium sp. MS 40/45]